MLALPGTGTVIIKNLAGGLEFGLPSGITAGNLTTTTTGLVIGSGTGATLTNATINYNLTTGVSSLTAGTQGVLGGTGVANTYVGADGQLHLLPVASSGGFTAGNLTTTTTGLTVGNGTSAVNGTGSTVDYNLVTGIGGLVSGAQGTIGGTGNANTYVGADGLKHLLPTLTLDTTYTASPTGSTVTYPVTYTKILYVAGNGLVQREGVDYTLSAGIATFTIPFGASGGGAGGETVLIANLTI